MITITGTITTTASTAIVMADGGRSPDEATSDTGLGPSGRGADDVLKLMVWLSPAFPVGGFTYSHGLEWAIEDGTVTTTAGLERWLADVVRHGAGRNDAIFFALAHRAMAADDIDALSDTVERAAAFQPSKERRLEATAQGAAFMRAILDTAPAEPLDRLLPLLAARFDGAMPWTYPVAVGIAAAAHGIALDLALPAYLQAFVQNVISAGVRAVPLGQTDGLRLVAALRPMIEAAATGALHASVDDLGGAVLRADIASMKHETQYTRLFRS
jgi:urease accessory protein